MDGEPPHVSAFYQTSVDQRTKYIDVTFQGTFGNVIQIIESKEFSLPCKNEALTITKLFITYKYFSTGTLDIFLQKVYGKWEFKHYQRAIAHLLQYAMERGDMDKIRKVLDFVGLEMIHEIRTADGLGPLGIAAVHGNPEIINMLVKNYKMDVNEKFRGDKRPVHLAAASNAANFLKLVELGADPFVTTRNGCKFPMWYAIKHSRAAVISFYLQHPQKPFKVKKGSFALLIRSGHCNEEVLQVLLDNVSCNWNQQFWAGVLLKGLNKFENDSLLLRLVRGIVKQSPPTTSGSSATTVTSTSQKQENDMTKPLRATQKSSLQGGGGYQVSYPYNPINVSLMQSILFTEEEHQRIRELVPISAVIERIISMIPDSVQLFHMIAHCWSLTKQELVDAHVIHRRIDKAWQRNQLTVHLIKMLPCNMQDDKGLYEIEYLPAYSFCVSLDWYFAAGLKPYLIRNQQTIPAALRYITRQSFLDEWINHGLELAGPCLALGKNYTSVKINYKNEERSFVIQSVDNVRSLLRYRYNQVLRNYHLEFYNEKGQTVPEAALKTQGVHRINVVTLSYYCNNKQRSLPGSFLDITIISTTRPQRE